MARLSRDSYPGLIPIGGGERPLYMQVGSGNYNGAYTDVTDISIRTQITDIDFASAQVYDTQQPATEADHSTLFFDVSVSSGAITLYRSTQAKATYGSSGMPFRYCIIGRVESTD